VDSVGSGVGEQGKEKKFKQVLRARLECDAYLPSED